MSYLFTTDDQWTVAEDGKTVMCGHKKIAVVCQQDDNNESPEYQEEITQANARLIAEAPAMYKLLERIMVSWRHSVIGEEHMLMIEGLRDRAEVEFITRYTGRAKRLLEAEGKNGSKRKKGN